MDRLGRLFVNYDYYPALLSDAHKAAYAKKWPADVTGSGTYIGRPQGYSMLMSDDNGDTWRLALTEDFVNGMKRKETK